MIVHRPFMLRNHYNSKYDLISALSKLLLNATNNLILLLDHSNR